MSKSKPTPTVIDTGTKIKLNANIQTYTKIPDRQKASSKAHVKIHVCQVSYGDCLALEIDHDPPNNYPATPPDGWDIRHLDPKDPGRSRDKWNEKQVGGLEALTKQRQVCSSLHTECKRY